ncbi:MAG: hypothetical protein WC804_01830 [Sphingomonas sp.]|jgi:hypothetical protein|uniref:hypothetical protein n=1 Tax=Sphingomonas sp. TaxID=28214 RepID=UPI00356B56DB
MITKTRDLNTQSTTLPLVSNGVNVGSTTIQYEVRKYVDLRNLGQSNWFVVTCTQRVILTNANAFSPAGGQVTSFDWYPALFTNQVTVEDPDAVIEKIAILDYFPRTLNTAVTASQNDSASSNTTVSQFYTSGSTTAQTNSYTTSVSEGFSGMTPTLQVSSGSDSASTYETSNAATSGNAVDNGAQFSNASSMSIKDWGSFAQLDPTGTSPTWIWGQEYPWDLIDFRNVDTTTDTVILPEYVQNRLYDGVQVYPPSELSLFGVNFVSQVSWLIQPDPAKFQTNSISFTHALTLCNATHGVSNGDFYAKIDTYGAISHTIASQDLSILALDPLGGSNGSATAVFVPNRFEVQPDSTGSDFALTTESNLLRVFGSGFTAVSASAFMSSDFSAGTCKLELHFKALDPTENLSLSFKHWTSNATGVQLSVTINGDTSSPIVKYLDATEAGSGGQTVTVVPLRRKRLTSVDFCDRVRPGHNVIEVEISLDDSSDLTTYTLMAVAVG